MRYVLLGFLIGLGAAFGFGLLLTTPHDLLGSFDPHHPATLLPIVAGRLHALRSQVRELRASDLLDAAMAALRARVQQESPTSSTPR